MKRRAEPPNTITDKKPKASFNLPLSCVLLHSMQLRNTKGIITTISGLNDYLGLIGAAGTKSILEDATALKITNID